MKLEQGTSEKCDCCRRFMVPKPGCSWAQSWSDSIYYGPDLHEPKWRCAICTEEHGRIEGNCAPGFDGIIEAAAEDITPMTKIDNAVQGEPEAQHKFKLGDAVRKTRGSQWRGLIVGSYSTSFTPVGYCVESMNEPGSVQIYPENALELLWERTYG